MSSSDQKTVRPSLVALAFTPSAWEAETCRSLSVLRSSWSTQWILGQILCLQKAKQGKKGSSLFRALGSGLGRYIHITGLRFQFEFEYSLPGNTPKGQQNSGRRRKHLSSKLLTWLESLGQGEAWAEPSCRPLPPSPDEGAVQVSSHSLHF